MKIIVKIVLLLCTALPAPALRVSLVAVCPDPSPADSISLTTGHVNPFTGRLQITVFVPGRKCMAGLDIFDPDMVYINTLYSDTATDGFEVFWNGKRYDGTPVSDGRYLCRVGCDTLQKYFPFLYFR